MLIILPEEIPDDVNCQNASVSGQEDGFHIWESIAG
jgi:hypothetical protein